MSRSSFARPSDYQMGVYDRRRWNRSTLVKRIKFTSTLLSWLWNWNLRGRAMMRGFLGLKQAEENQ